MNATQAYRQTHAQAGGPKRIDLLLALFDGAIERLARAQAFLQKGDQVAANSLAARAQIIVMELAAGVRPDVSPEVSMNILRLYEFATNHLTQVTMSTLQETAMILSTLREGFRAIRDEAVRLENTGAIAAVQDTTLIAASA